MEKTFAFDCNDGIRQIEAKTKNQIEIENRSTKSSNYKDTSNKKQEEDRENDEGPDK